jgi:hypothetical protein
MQAYDQLTEQEAHDHAAIIESANRYVCPRGAAPGYATILGLYSDVQQWSQLSASTGNSGTAPLIFGSDQNQVQFQQMLFLTAEQIVPGAANDPNALYICHLADIRWLMQRLTMFKSYNVRSLGSPTAEYWSETEDPQAALLYNGNPGPGVGPWTWPKMLNDIWSPLLSFVPIPGFSSILNDIPNITGINPERFRFFEDSPLAAYEECLSTVMCSLAYDPFQNQFTPVLKGFPDPQFQLLQQSLAGSILDATNPIDSLGTWFPANVDVVFLALYNGAPEQQVTDSPYFVITITPSVTYPGSTTNYPANASPVLQTTDAIFAPLDAQMCCGGTMLTPFWQPNTAYTAGQKVQPSPSYAPVMPRNNHTYVVTTAGTSGLNQPTWPLTTGGTVSDGGVTWTESTILPTNYSQMFTLANALALAYYNMLDQAMRRKVWVYDGLQAFTPGSMVGQVEWHLNRDGAETRVIAAN